MEPDSWRDYSISREQKIGWFLAGICVGMTICGLFGFGLLLINIRSM